MGRTTSNKRRQRFNLGTAGLPTRDYQRYMHRDHPFRHIPTPLPPRPDVGQRRYDLATSEERVAPPEAYLNNPDPTLRLSEKAIQKRVREERINRLRRRRFGNQTSYYTIPARAEIYANRQNDDEDAAVTDDRVDRRRAEMAEHAMGKLGLSSDIGHHIASFLRPSIPRGNGVKCKRKTTF